MGITRVSLIFPRWLSLKIGIVFSCAVICEFCSLVWQTRLVAYRFSSHPHWNKGLGWVTQNWIFMFSWSFHKRTTRSNVYWPVQPFFRWRNNCVAPWKTSILSKMNFPKALHFWKAQQVNSRRCRVARLAKTTQILMALAGATRA